MKYLFFDTETTGLVDFSLNPRVDFSKFPFLVQLAWILYDSDTYQTSYNDYIIFPENFEIPAGMVHNITQDIAMANGRPIVEVLKKFTSDLHAANMYICHNVQFDRVILQTECMRNDLYFLYQLLSDKPNFCTMTGYKDIIKKDRVKLSELYFRIFKKELEGAHDALVDAMTTFKIFMTLETANWKEWSTSGKILE